MPRFWLAAAVLIVASGCRRQREPVVARVGRLTITEPEFRRKLMDVAPDYQNYVLTPNGRRQFLDVLIREKLILAAAADSGVDRAPEFRAQYERLKADVNEQLQDGRNHLLTRLWLEDLRKKGVVTVTDDEVKSFYDKHAVEVEMRHILLASSEEAEKAFKRVKGGAGFAALAKTNSLDAETAVAGGRMRPAIYGEIIPELEDVAFKMRVGESVGPIRSKFGYHVLHKDSERRVPFASAEERIRRVLEKQKLDLFLQTLQSKFPVEVVDAQFK